MVGHLLDLENPPDPELVDQTLEVGEALAAATTRIAVERGDSKQLERARELIKRLGDSELSSDERLEISHELGQVFMDASDNLVLHLVRRGLRTQVFERLRHLHAQPEVASVERLAKDLSRAIEQRDPAQASEAVHSLWRSLRESVRRSLEAARADGNAADV